MNNNNKFFPKKNNFLIGTPDGVLIKQSFAKNKYDVLEDVADYFRLVITNDSEYRQEVGFNRKKYEYDELVVYMEVL